MEIVNDRFFRLEPEDSSDPVAFARSPRLEFRPELVGKVRRSDGIVVATWDSDEQHGKVHALGIVQEVNTTSAVITWRRANFTLHPSPQGARQWQTRPAFKFNDVVATRYRLIDYFRAAFANQAPMPASPLPPTIEAPNAAKDSAMHPEKPELGPKPRPETRAPQRNRVAPNGEIFATRARGTFMGNRTSPPRWLICDLDFERELKEERKYTKLFFLDEAVALAGGHRPCNTCRRARYQTYVEAVRRDIAVGSAAELDRALNAARHSPHRSCQIASVPEGTFIALKDNDFRLKLDNHLHRWTPAGYVDPVALEDLSVQEAVVLTPDVSVFALRNGYTPLVHHSVTRR